MFARNSDLTWVAWLRSRFAEARSPYSRAPSRTIAACSARSCTRSRSSDAKSGARLPMTTSTPIRRPLPVIGAASAAPAVVRTKRGVWVSTTLAISSADERSSSSSAIANASVFSSMRPMRADWPGAALAIATSRPRRIVWGESCGEIAAARVKKERRAGSRQARFRRTGGANATTYPAAEISARTIDPTLLAVGPTIVEVTATRRVRLRASAPDAAATIRFRATPFASRASRMRTMPA